MNHLPKSIHAALIALVIAVVVITVPAQAADKINRVALIPLTIHAAQDMNFLAQGIVDMLTSRLASDDVELIDPSTIDVAMASIKPPITPQKAASVAVKTKADFVIYGSLTSLGNNMSVNWQILKASDPKKPVGLARTTTQEKLIATVDEMALLARQVISGKSLTALVVPVAPQAQTQSGSSTTSKPKKTRTAFVGSDTSKGQSAGALDSDQDALATFASGTSAAGIFDIRPTFPAPVTMSSGDVDGDGTSELLLLSHDSLAIYKYNEKGFHQHIRIPKPMKGQMIMVSAGDVDRDGKAEIAITSVYGSLARGKIFRLNKEKLVEITGLSRFHLRIINSPQGPIIAGQESTLTKLFDGSFKRYSLSGGGLHEAGSIPGLDKITFPTLLLTDLDRDGQTEYVGLSWEEKLTVVSGANKVLFRSQGKFSGTNNIYRPETAERQDVSENLHFINAGLSVADLEGDGKPELIVTHNEETTRRVTLEMRYYSQGSVFAFNWNGETLVQAFRTPIVEQYVASAEVIKIPDGGQKMLVMAATDPVAFGGVLTLFSKTKGYLFYAPATAD